MAYVTPTPADLKAFYPEATSIVDSSPTLVSAILVEAERETNATWDDADRFAGVMTLTMHWMVRRGLLAQTISVGGTTTIGGIQVSGAAQRFKVGDTEVAFASNSSSGSSGSSGGSSSSDYDSTIYGQRWLELLARNTPGGAAGASSIQLLDRY